MAPILTTGAGAYIAAAGFTPTIWDASHKAASITLSGSPLVTATLGSSGAALVRSVAGYSSGKKYFELTLGGPGGNYTVGFGNSSMVLSGTYPSNDLNSFGWLGDEVLLNGARLTGSSHTTALTTGSTICLAVDFGAMRLWNRVGTAAGTWWGPGGATTGDPTSSGTGFDFSAINSGPYYAYFFSDISGDTSTANFGASAFTNAPSGYTGW
jgi:hypothetical protein